MSKHICKSLEELPKIVEALLPEILTHRVVSFDAPMGAGKTTFIKAICMALGVDEGEIHSPTYSLVNEYQAGGQTIYHFDFYRLKSMQEAYDLGLEEYFIKDAICLMEWAEMVAPLLPYPLLKIKIEQEDETRIFRSEIINFLQTGNFT